MLRTLVRHTALYGVSSIVARVANFLLTPFYTHIFAPSDYGIFSELYAYAAFVLVFLTFGTETALFRFANPKQPQHQQTYSSLLTLVLLCTGLFWVVMLIFAQPAATALGYADAWDYVLVFAAILGLDAICAVPLARLRQLNRPLHFVFVNLGSIGINIGLNFFFLLLMPYWHEQQALPAALHNLYNPQYGLGYVFLSNLGASIFKVLALLPVLKQFRPRFNRSEAKRLLNYCLPLLVLSLAGIVNETFDRVALRSLLDLPQKEALALVGIYNGCYKVAMLLSIGVQAFRFAAEPLVFGESTKDSQKLQRRMMTLYTAVALWVVCVLVVFLDFALLLIAEPYRVGKGVIPILLCAYVLYGLVLNLSYWYKLNEKTRFGAYIALSGAAVTLITNVLLVPKIGYFGAAWATLFAYATMLLLSWYWGRPYHNNNYDFKRLLVLVAVGASATFVGAIGLSPWNNPVHFLLGVGLMAALAALFWKVVRDSIRHEPATE